ncbi:extracellular solute-binding protein [Sneathiella chungangensis]|uniref:Extracellular solute-binding protein n=1 Tax=Sneathiella chungangensis TaxID=1418234 RepID=A0A845MAK0_9PROT|nr:extracellular solute-binding protein [Sneathiella chungangensis]MZR20921.1 extracellular solute-binding protein [Sneathiella chungangensis]
MKRWFIMFALAIFGAAMSSSAIAEVIHATWGGGGAINLAKYVTDPFTEKTGIVAKVAEVPNTAGTVRSPNASQYNVVTVTYFESIAMADLDLLEEFEDSELPGVQNLPPELVVRNSAGKIVGIPTSFGYLGIAFRNDMATAADFASWNNLADPKWKGKLSITRPIYAAPYDLTMFAHANGGDANNVEPGMATLKGLIANSLTTYTSLAHMNTLLGRGEVIAVPYYSTRIWQMRRDGVTNLDIVIPKEGALMLPYAAVVPKGSSNRADTITYLEWLISAHSQKAMALATGSLPTNTTVILPPEFEQSIGMPMKELLAKMYVPDWKVVVANREERVDAVEQIMANTQK